jgi:hypothetical protein
MLSQDVHVPHVVADSEDLNVTTDRTPEECQSRCERTAECAAFTLLSGGSEKGHCRLKDDRFWRRARRLPSTSRTVSGVTAWRLYADVSCSDHGRGAEDLKQRARENSSISTCRSSCLTMPDCEGFLYRHRSCLFKTMIVPDQCSAGDFQLHRLSTRRTSPLESGRLSPAKCDALLSNPNDK